MITIVDYGVGNIGSIKNMLKRIGATSEIVSEPEGVSGAKKILLPGVGSFDAAMKKLDENGLKEILDRKALEERVPLLGICLGMQLLTKGSEEGELQGFGWIDASTKKISNRSGIKVPHMGWNFVKKCSPSELTRDLGKDARFYFVHSYEVVVKNPENIILKTEYGEDLVSAIQNDNIYGTQFHPEKSHKFGMQIFENFAALSC